MICVFVLKLLFLIVDKQLPFFYFSNHFLRYSQSSIAVLRLCWLLNNHSSFDLIQIVKVKLITNLPANVYRPFFQIKVRKFQTHYFALSQSAEKAEQYKQQAIEELTALGVTFPVQIDYYIIASNQTALDSANVLKQAFSDSLGDDFVQLNIKTYIKSLRQEVLDPHLQSFVLNGWGADYGDPQNFLGQEMYGYDNADYSANYSFVNEVSEETEANKELLATYKEYTALVEAADEITDDLDARYAAYAKAEAYMLEHVLVLPSSYGVGWALSKIDNDTKMNAMFGVQNNKMKNWDTNVNGYTSEDKGVADQIAAYSQQ